MAFGSSWQSGSSLTTFSGGGNVIKTTLERIIIAQPALGRLASQPLPVKLAYNVARMIRAMQPELEEFTRQRNEIVMKQGVARKAADGEAPFKDGEVYDIGPEHKDEVLGKIKELMSVTVELDRRPLSLNGSLVITPSDLLLLEDFVQVDEDPA